MEDVGWAEYAVFILVLAVSVGIGVFYGCFGSKQKSTNEYLLANRQMSAFPVAVSQICTAISAISLLGNPVEVYLYGLPFMMVILYLIPFTFSLVYLYIPVYFQLNVNSAYQYIEMRFNEKVRVFVSLIAIIHVIVSMAIAIYSSALAVQSVTGIATEISTAVIYLVCIFYSALGGLKAVMWTDVFQSFIMLASLVAIAGKGLVDIGGFSVLWERTSAGGRLEAFNFSLDPRTRHTIWTGVIAGYFFSLPVYAATQVQVQRFLSMPDMKTVKNSLMINMLGLVVMNALCVLTGLIIFAKYYDCDPLSAKVVAKSDQLVPYFAKETVDGMPGLLGLFTAGITCASMSSLSSGLTALASITTFDYVQKIFPTLSDFQLSTISKINTLLLGLLSYCFVFVIQNMGSVLPVTSSFFGIMLGPTLGIFTLGMMFPWANAPGSFCGMVLSFLIMLTHVVFSNIYAGSLPDQRLPMSTAGCTNYTNDSFLSSWNTSISTNWENNDDPFLIQVLSISYTWYSGVGTLLCVILGLLCSILVNLVGNQSEPYVKVSYKCLSPPLAKLYRKVFPNHIMRWVDYMNEDDCNLSQKSLSIQIKQ